VCQKEDNSSLRFPTCPKGIWGDPDILLQTARQCHLLDIYGSAPGTKVQEPKGSTEPMASSEGRVCTACPVTMALGKRGWDSQPFCVHLVLVAELPNPL
jgi:hypothetical protein